MSTCTRWLFGLVKFAGKSDDSDSRNGLKTAGEEAGAKRLSDPLQGRRVIGNISKGESRGSTKTRP